MALKSLYGSFCVIGTVVIRGDESAYDATLFEGCNEGLGHGVVGDFVDWLECTVGTGCFEYFEDR